jgi:hypothetical protein
MECFYEDTAFDLRFEAWTENIRWLGIARNILANSLFL